MLLALECHPLDWFSLDLFKCSQHHSHLVKRHHYIHQSATLLYLSPLMSSLIGHCCWLSFFEVVYSSVDLFWISWTGVIGTVLLLMFLKVGVFLLILDVSVLTHACCCSFTWTSKLVIEFMYSSLPISVLFDKVLLLLVLFMIGSLK